MTNYNVKQIETDFISLVEALVKNPPHDRSVNSIEEGAFRWTSYFLFAVGQINRKSQNKEN